MMFQTTKGVDMVRSKKYRLAMLMLELTDILIGTRMVKRFTKDCNQYNNDCKPKIKKGIKGEQREVD